MLHTPTCYKCGGNTRLVAYRYNNGAPTWTCATDAGQSVDSSRRTMSAQREVEAEASPRLPPAPRRERPEPAGLKPRYTGPRQRNDPLGF